MISVHNIQSEDIRFLIKEEHRSPHPNSRIHHRDFFDLVRSSEFDLDFDLFAVSVFLF